MSHSQDNVDNVDVDPSADVLANSNKPPTPINVTLNKRLKAKQNLLISLVPLVVNTIVLGFSFRFRKECPVEPMIPIYLIVHGSFGIFINLIELKQKCFKRDEEEEEPMQPIQPLIYAFMLAWFIVGCVYIYRARAKVNTKDSMQPHYCNEILYWSAFWFANVLNVIIGVIICYTCFGLIHDGPGHVTKKENKQPNIV